jgi:hypothetical protein
LNYEKPSIATYVLNVVIRTKINNKSFVKSKLGEHQTSLFSLNFLKNAKLDAYATLIEIVLPLIGLYMLSV